MHGSGLFLSLVVEAVCDYFHLRNWREGNAACRWM